MSGGAVIVVGPATVCGPGAVDADLAMSALCCIDDDVGLVGTKVVRSQTVWSDVMTAAVGAPVDRLSVVCPSYWPANRIGRVRDAGRVMAPEVVVRDRRDALREIAGGTDSPVIEIGEDLVVLSRPGSPAAAARRSSAALELMVTQHLPGAPTVIIDAPEGIVGAGQVSAELAKLLDRNGIEVVTLSCADLCRAADVPTPGRWPLVRVGAVAVTLAVAGVAVFSGQDMEVRAPPPAADAELTWVVEGHVAVRVPARWAVNRAASGAGSARVQVVSPDDPGRIIHFTQTPVPSRPTLAESAQVLRTAAAALPDGVIVDFDDSATVAGRAAVTYREVRADRAVRWTVVLDDAIRIAIGCQGSEIADRCDQAIRSAHRVG
ncbi:type VII secretion-associated protein (TIGR03931 family) [Mycobacterium sp. MAA66]|uniref:type VII secretion-associated protein n=1 Tax=Mycobacterium sp. MAA66 TaxID=3156297 RepID=UPI00351211C8